MSSETSQTSGPTCAPGTLEEELQKIEREQAEVVDLEAKEAELDELRQRARHLADELRVAANARRRRSAEQALPVIHPREPCAAVWADMTGDERVRACGRCKARVYDLGGLDPADARKLLTEKEGKLPTHVMGRVDGTVTLESCEAKRTRLSPTAIALSACGAASVLATGLCIGLLLGDSPEAMVIEDRPATAAVEMQELVDALVADKMQAELEQRAKLAAEQAAAEEAARAAEAERAAAAKRAEEKRRAESDDRPPDSHRRRRCRPRRRLYDPFASPFFFFWDSSYEGTPEDTGGCDDAG